MAERKCLTDYKTIPLPGGSFRDRIRRALQEAKAAQISRAKAVSYIALSVRESNVEWTTVRVPDLGAQSCLCRTTVGLELASFRPPRFRDSAANDVGARLFLVANGMAVEDGTGLKATGDSLKPNSAGIARFFEFIVARRAEALLDNISLGPTQLWLKFAFNPAACGRPGSWEAIWALYLSVDVAEVLQRTTYLDTGTCTSNPFPGTIGGDPKAKSVAWLTGHTGNAVAAEKYYEGTGINESSKAYKNALFITNQEADSIGYAH